MELSGLMLLGLRPGLAGGNSRLDMPQDGRLWRRPTAVAVFHSCLKLFLLVNSWPQA